MKISINRCSKNHITIISDEIINCTNAIKQLYFVSALLRSTNYQIDIWYQNKYTYENVVNEIQKFMNFNFHEDQIEWTIEKEEVKIKIIKIDENNLEILTNSNIDISKIQNIYGVSEYSRIGNKIKLSFKQNFESIKSDIELFFKDEHIYKNSNYLIKII